MHKVLVVIAVALLARAGWRQGSRSRALPRSTDANVVLVVSLDAARHAIVHAMSCDLQ